MSDSLQRRQVLSGLMKLLAFIGLVFVSIPFVSSLITNTTENSKWVITLPLSELVESEVKQLEWSGRIVWVYKRTEDEIALLKKHNNTLRDALSKLSVQPEKMKNTLRSADEQLFVFIPLENKKGCQVRLSEDKQSVFSEPCFGARFDAAGRILKNTGHAEQQNLAVPDHIIEDGLLKIAIWAPKINNL